MKSVAEHATQELGPALSSDYHLTLSYTEAEEKQQVLTKAVGYFPTDYDQQSPIFRRGLLTDTVTSSR